jgi:fumarate reductase subunit D
VKDWVVFGAGLVVIAATGPVLDLPVGLCAAFGFVYGFFCTPKWGPLKEDTDV